MPQQDANAAENKQQQTTAPANSTSAPPTSQHGDDGKATPSALSPPTPKGNQVMPSRVEDAKVPKRANTLAGVSKEFLHDFMLRVLPQFGIDRNALTTPKTREEWVARLQPQEGAHVVNIAKQDVTTCKDEDGQEVELVNLGDGLQARKSDVELARKLVRLPRCRRYLDKTTYELVEAEVDLKELPAKIDADTPLLVRIKGDPNAKWMDFLKARDVALIQTSDIVDFIVKPITQWKDGKQIIHQVINKEVIKSERKTYAEHMMEVHPKGPEWVERNYFGEALTRGGNIFVSHAWMDSYLDFSDALTEGTSDLGSQDYRDTITKELKIHRLFDGWVKDRTASDNPCDMYFKSKFSLGARFLRYFGHGIPPPATAPSTGTATAPSTGTQSQTDELSLTNAFAQLLAFPLYCLDFAICTVLFFSLGGCVGIFLDTYYGMLTTKQLHDMVSYFRQKGLGWDRNRHWIDIFCKNQWVVNSGDTESELMQSVANVDCLYLVCHSWNTPQTLKRVWCQFELRAARMCGVDIVGVVCNQEIVNLRTKIATLFKNAWVWLYVLFPPFLVDSYHSLKGVHVTKESGDLKKTIDSIDVENAEATVEADRDYILNLIGQGNASTSTNGNGDNNDGLDGQRPHSSSDSRKADAIKAHNEALKECYARLLYKILRNILSGHFSHEDSSDLRIRSSLGYGVSAQRSVVQIQSFAFNALIFVAFSVTTCFAILVYAVDSRRAFHLAFFIGVLLCLILAIVIGALELGNYFIPRYFIDQIFTKTMRQNWKEVNENDDEDGKVPVSLLFFYGGIAGILYTIYHFITNGNL